MTLKTLDEDALALTQFQAEAAQDPEAAVANLEAKGYALKNAKLIPTPATDKRAELVANGATSALETFDAVNHAALARESRAVAHAEAIINGADLLAAMNPYDRWETMMHRRGPASRLSALEIVRRFKAEGNQRAAAQFESANHAEYEADLARERAANPQGDQARILRRDKETAVQAVRARHTDARGNLIETPAYRAEVDAVEQQFGAKLAQASDEGRTSSAYDTWIAMRALSPMQAAIFFQTNTAAIEASRPKGG